MNLRCAAALFALLIGGFAVTRAEGGSAEAKTIVDAERAFARASVEKGMREAFLEFLDEDGVVFRPQPVSGKAFYRERPPRPGALIWQPAHAELAEAGDMGYTTGPWEYREGGPEGKAIAWGYYISVWHDTPDSGWKVLADIGIGLPAPVDSVVERAVATVRPPTALIRCADPAAAVLDEDLMLADAATEDSYSTVLSDAATDDVRVYRDGAPPWVGRDTAARELAALGGSWSCTPIGGGGSSSGDFGYSYGTAEPVPADSSAAGPGSYLHIWRLDGERGWSLALEVILPGPPKTE
jgi:ketosteroid isomerase-like protein